MSVGEKIQTYRKRLGLSQDELGQKLLVSRQTISLWEKDQTVPTIDNLIRLREIFGVSLDAILGFVSEEKEEALPKEEYKFTYSREELAAIDRLQKKGLYTRPILLAVICVIAFLMLVFLDAPNFLCGVFVGVFLMGETAHIKGIRAYKKAWPNTAERIAEQTYEYKVFDEYLGINMYRENGIIVRQSKCYYKDIEKIVPFGKWLILQYGGQAFILRKSDLREDSFFLSYTPQPKPEKVPLVTPSKWKAASIILFVASLMSIFGALFLVNIAFEMSGSIDDAIKYMWLFFTMTPIPIASIIFGFVAKAKGYRCKKNIIVGFIMTALLCLYGSFTFIFAGI